MIELWQVLLAFAAALCIGMAMGWFLCRWLTDSKVRDLRALLPPTELMRWVAMAAYMHRVNTPGERGDIERLVAYANAIEAAGYGSR